MAPGNSMTVKVVIWSASSEASVAAFATAVVTVTAFACACRSDATASCCTAVSGAFTASAYTRTVTSACCPGSRGIEHVKVVVPTSHAIGSPSTSTWTSR